tara:strand:- start:2326 stop:3012 length:687 start_codon:yes stop_codon:yes gene_type:complete
MEEFRDIPGYEGLYQVSNLGNVKSLGNDKAKKEKILKQNLVGVISKQYFAVQFCVDGKRKTYKVHQLVAMAFLNHIPNGFVGLVVDHIDNNKLNNNLENLQLISARKNNSKDKTGGASQYVGVNWHKPNKKWAALIWINGKHRYLGYFTCELEASEAYQKALKDYELDGTMPEPWTYSSQYKGVSWHKPSKKWTAKIYINGKAKYLGSFKCELEASEAYQKALRELSE